MESGDMGLIVDKLAEKIGVAAEKLAPIAEEALRQYVVRESIYAIMGGVAVLIGIGLLTICWKSAKEHMVNDEELYFGAGMVSGIGGILFSTIGFVEGVTGLVNAIAPIPGLLGV